MRLSCSKLKILLQLRELINWPLFKFTTVYFLLLAFDPKGGCVPTKHWRDIGKYYIESCSHKNIYDAQLDKLWLIVKGQQTQSLKRIPHDQPNAQEVTLRKGDVIKLGRIAFRVRDLHIEGAASDGTDHYEGPYQDDHIDFLPAKFIPRFAFQFLGTALERPNNLFGCSPGNTEVCRICYSDIHLAENPLLSVCNCTGTLRFIHYKCLQAWLATKLTVKKQGNVTSYYLKSLECEICKSSYPCNLFVLHPFEHETNIHRYGDNWS